MKYKLVCLIMLIWLTANGIQAQSLDNWVIGSGGSTSLSNQVQLNWTLGETLVDAIPTNSGWLTEGFHQPYLQVVVLDDNQIVKDETNIRVYPNPVHTELIIDPANTLTGNFNYVLTDMQGKTIEFGQVETGSQKILNVNALLPASYILLVRPEDPERTEIYQFKIIKQ